MKSLGNLGDESQAAGRREGRSEKEGGRLRRRPATGLAAGEGWGRGIEAEA